MKRKLVRQGKTALTITLPSSWAKKYGLNAGDEIEIEETGKNLTVSTSKLAETKERIEVDAAKFKSFIFTYIMALYRKGYDEIKINFKDSSLVPKLHTIINALLGFEIINEEKNSCTFKAITLPSEEQFDPIFKRLFLVTISMAEDSLNAIKSNDRATLNNMQYRDENTINRFANFCLRILNKRGYKEFEKTSLFYKLIRDIENISDQYKHLSLYKAKSPGKIDNKILELYEEINNLLKDDYDLFYRFNEESLIKISEKRRALEEKIKKIKVQDVRMISYLINILELIISTVETQMSLYS